MKLPNLSRPGQHKSQELLDICAKTNMVIYKTKEVIDENKQIPLDIGFAVGLKNIERSLTTESDGVSELSVAKKGIKRKYIPYTNNRLGWHTDGCYNDPKTPINGFILHCVRSAEEGGENCLLDPDIAYILLRDENPDFIDGLLLDDALTIPKNEKDGVIIRQQRTGPALKIQQNVIASYNRTIHFRYTGRKNFVIWKNDARIMGALDFLGKILKNECPYIFRVKLKPGSGIIGNNILHNRTAFKNGISANSKRLFYRIYYRDRVEDPSIQGIKNGKK